MKRLSLVTTVTLSAVAVALAAAPGGAVGAKPFRPGSSTTVSSPVSNPSPAPGPGVAQPFQPGSGQTSDATAVVSPQPGADVAQPYQPGGGTISTNPAIFTLQYNPSALNLGVVKAYVPRPSSAVLTVTSPSDGTVTAELEPKGPFQVTRLTRYQFSIPTSSVNGSGGSGTGIGGSLASARPRERMESVAGGSALAVKAGDAVEIEVSLQATAGMFRHPRATLRVRGADWRIGVPVGATVIEYPEIDPIIPGELKIAPGGEAELPVRLDRTLTSWTNPGGQTRTVTIKAQTLPAGVTMEPVSVVVPVNVEYVDTVLRFHAADTAPARRDQPTHLLVDSGADRELFSLAGHVYPREKTWTYEQQSGDVHVQGELTIRADGTWRWKANLHDSGTVVGDWFGTGVAINLFETKQIGGNRGGVTPTQYPLIMLPTFATGYLGGGVVGGSQDQTIQMSHEGNPSNVLGPLPALKKYYCEAVDAGIIKELKAASDYGPMVKLFVNTLWEYVGAAGISQ
jgi:hypothetical protein